MKTPRRIELLAPAANADTAIEAILHGADAVYIGPPTHGARKSASNSIEDIRRVVEFAHPYGVKVYATVNTIIYNREIKDVDNLIRDLYKIGVDAIIVQDMGILRMDIPPIALHASTQCHTTTADKARFLQDAGFSQIVLARELNLSEIKNIAESVDTPLECFIHGALCVSYSGRCHASQDIFKRSANRGECAQICRWAFNLLDADDKIIVSNQHLLSLKDLNLYDRIEDLMQAGVTSFKIEGRLKDSSYVKNVVALYRQKIDEIISRNPDLYSRASYGISKISFTPQADKSFNRGFTHFFIDELKPRDITSPLTPKSMGEEISDISQLHNGDGISFFNNKNEYEGVMVNGISGNKIIGNRDFILPKNVTIHRTFDLKWQKLLSKPSAERRLKIDVEITDSYIKGVDERGVKSIIPLPQNLQPAQNKISLRNHFDKLGNTIFYLDQFDDSGCNLFIPPSMLSSLRRQLIQKMMLTSKATYKFDYRKKECSDIPYISKEADFHENISNSLAESFYADHGVTDFEPALEVKSVNSTRKVIMTTRHCILRELGKCLKTTPASKRNFRLPLRLESGKNKLFLKFDCENCQMQVIR